MTARRRTDQWGPINVGVYGCTAAGKTRFLFELLRAWERDRRLLTLSENCQRFLATVEGEVTKFSGSRGTTAPTEGIEVRVRGGEKDQPTDWVFRDLRGELLSDEVDQLSTLGRGGLIPTQVRLCDGFLFFFDPLSSEDGGDVEAHHRRELRRAELFIDYVLESRQNRHLPIVFVLTHHDVWAGDEQASELARRWADDAYTRLQARVAARLGGHRPDGLLDREKVTAVVASTSGQGVEAVVEQLRELVTASREFAAADRRRGGRFLAGGLAAVILMAIVGVWLIGSSGQGGGPAGPPGKADRTTVAGWGDAEVAPRLAELERMIASQPPVGELPRVEEAKRVNPHLRWLPVRIQLAEPDRDGPAELSPATRNRMRTALDAAGRMVRDQTSKGNGVLPDRIAVLRAYLDDLPDLSGVSADLGAAQKLYWKLKRDAAVELLAEAISQRRNSGASATELLPQVAVKLKDLEQEVTREKVFGPPERKALLGEIQTAVALCEDRARAGHYEVNFKVSRASAANAGPEWRSLMIDPGGPNAREFALRPSRAGRGEQTYSTKEGSYRLKLGLGPRVIARLNAHLPDQDRWEKLHDFNLPGEPGPLAALGLPLYRRGQQALTQTLRWEGYDLTVEFGDFPAVPDLLWDAAERSAKGGGR